MPYQNVDAHVEVGIPEDDGASVELPVTAITGKRSRHTNADMGSVAAVTSGGIPTRQDESRITVNGNVIVRGTINAIEDQKDGSHHVQFFSAVRDLNQKSISRAYENARADKLLEDVFEYAGLTGRVVLSAATRARMARGGAGGAPRGSGGVVAGAPASSRYSITEQFSNAKCTTVIERVCRAVGWYWYVSRDNTVTVIDRFEHERAPIHGGIDTGEPLAIPDDARQFYTHPLKYVIDSSTGQLEPPFKKVIVYGSSAPEDASMQHLISHSPVWGAATSGGYEAGDPIFTYRDKMVNTQEMAEAAALHILKTFQSQQQGGWVKLVGCSAIRPFDLIEMPNGEDGRPDHGGEIFMVQGVEHTVNNTDGFVTYVTVGGLASGGGETTSGGGETGTPPAAGDEDDETPADGDGGGSAPPAGGGSGPGSGGGTSGGSDGDGEGGVFPFEPILPPVLDPFN